MSWCTCNRVGLHLSCDPSPEPAFTLTQVEAHVEKLAGLVEGKIEPIGRQSSLGDWRELKSRNDAFDEVLELLRTTPIEKESA